MHCFYIEPGQIMDEQIRIIGDDVNHIKNVLRKSIGDKVVLCDGAGSFYTCEIVELAGKEIETRILKKEEAKTELPAKIYLFQGLPKKDKMELIIQKAVELGAYEIIPVATKFCVAKIEDKKKEAKKLERWQAISEAAAKQSGRGIIPKVSAVMTYKEAINFAKTLDGGILPYECSDGMEASRQAIDEACKGKSIAVFIGPEGGFSEEEAEFAMNSGIKPITLGKRILRTETAGLTTLSLLMYQIEYEAEKKKK